MMPPEHHQPSGLLNISGDDYVPIRTIFHDMLITIGGGCVLVGTGSRIVIAANNTAFYIVKSQSTQYLSPKIIENNFIFNKAKNLSHVFQKEFNKSIFYKNMVRVGWPIIGVGVILKVGDHLGTTIYNKLFSKKLDQKAES